MDTAPLKTFATWARTALIREVTARIAVVLAPSSPQRIEQPKAIAALEKAITAAGGGDKGRSAVTDRVAYTWFNRIIALRFMDANGYTGIGVVSPHVGNDVGQPEILAEAKHANIDPAVVSENIRETVTGLLNGTRRSDDPQGEAYAVLLIEYCRYWNRTMPFMFEREGDFTELLMPANLLADDSVLNRSVRVLSEEVCQDVEVIGWLYQFYISERKDEVFAGFKMDKKAGMEEIPAATQLFSPHWIVRFLVENTLGRLWMLNHPKSRLADQMEYYVDPVDDETAFRKIKSPEELKVLDPAVGSGHMLTYAFDLLYFIYEEEGYSPNEIPGLILARNLYGIEIDPRAGALAAFALTMKARARQRTFFGKHVQPNVLVLEPLAFAPRELDSLHMLVSDHDHELEYWNQFSEADSLGSLIRPDEHITRAISPRIKADSHEADLFAADLHSRCLRVLEYAAYLSARYHVVIANPPYMDARNMSAGLIGYLEQHYSRASTGLDIAFIDRASSFVQPGGFIGFLTLDSWMSSFETRPLREHLLDEARIRMVLHLGPGAFDQISGEVVRVAATVFGPIANAATPIVFLDAADLPRGRKEAYLHDSARKFVRLPAWFEPFPVRSIAPFGATDEVRELYAHGVPLSRYAEARTGLQTGDNARFIRFWHELGRSEIRNESDRKPWVWYVKSTDAWRWFAREDKVLCWGRDGENIRSHASSVVRNSAFHFREGISFAGRGKELKARYVLPGAISDQQNSMVFVHGMSINFALGLLNSRAAEVLARAASPAKFNIGAMKKIPVKTEIVSDCVVEADVSRAIELSKDAWDSSETSPGFRTSTLLKSPHRDEELSLRPAFEAVRAASEAAATELVEIERRLDDYFGRYFGLPERRDWNATLPIASKAVLADDLISFAVGCMFGRFSLNKPGLVLVDHGATLSDYLAKVPAPQFMPDADNAIPIVDGDWFEDDIVTRFRQFLRAAFGDQHFEENLRFVTEALGVKDLRDYFVKSFYKDHVQRYKKRPIYWLFSSPKGSFNALIYMHRYTPSTVSTVLNEYLREFKAKLAAALGQQERLAVGGETPRQQAVAQKEADRIRKMLLELDEYEHDVLYPLASQQIEIDLDDGVRVNYPKFGAALKKIPGLEVAE